uniref:Ig-like domain-containing protein n=1 Tax=Astyanax mexicanus TaxID=7994 RepID=A0A3B1KB56_ASTMX
PREADQEVTRLASPGSTVLLSCKYEGTANNLQWYRQYPGSRPENLLIVFPGSESKRQGRFEATMNKTAVSLEISSTAVSDSALYYCALRPTCLYDVCRAVLSAALIFFRILMPTCFEKPNLILLPSEQTFTVFRYLGINITHNISSTVRVNFPPLITEMNADFQRWNNLPLSLAGRVQCVKMNILPKFLFLFQCPPVFLLKSFLKTLTGL